MLEFHHLDASKKKFALGQGADWGWDAILEELNKCVVLCASCHAMLHSGLITISNEEICQVNGDWLLCFKYEKNSGGVHEGEEEHAHPD